MKTSGSKPEMNTLQSFFSNDRIMLALVFVNTLFIFVGGYFSGDDWATFPLFIGRETLDLVARLTRTGYAILYFFGGVMGLSLVNSIFGITQTQHH